MNCLSTFANLSTICIYWGKLKKLDFNDLTARQKEGQNLHTGHNLMKMHLSAFCVLVKKESIVGMNLLAGWLKVSKFQKQIFLFSFEPKTQRNYFLISALPSKNESNQKNEGTLLY